MTWVCADTVGDIQEAKNNIDWISRIVVRLLWGGEVSNDRKIKVRGFS